MEKVVSNVAWEGKTGDVVIKEISWKEKTDTIKKAMREIVSGRVLKKEMDPVLQKNYAILASIKTAPFPVDLASLEKISAKDGERIFKAYSELNELSEEEPQGN